MWALSLSLQATTEQIRIAQLINNNKDEPEVQAKCQQIMDVTGRDLEVWLKDVRRWTQPLLIDQFFILTRGYF